MPTLVCLVILVTAFASYSNGQKYICDDGENNMPVCECTDAVCYFKLVIEHFQTFTAYEKQAPMGTRGRIFYIENNSLIPTQTGENLPCDDMDKCTEPNTVDGKTYRSFISVNKRIPGPTLIVNENARVVVDVVNSLFTEEISIHWHGIHQLNTPWMDGVGYITQCPIEAGTTFRYIFEATPTGTFWYHSHSGAQRTDGLFGALIVKENNSDIFPGIEDNPGNHTLILLDWAREASLDLFVQIHSSLGFYEEIPLEQVPKPMDKRYVPTCSADGAEVGPIPYWSGIVNGLGKHKNISFNGSRLSVFNVESERRYRFRLIGAQANYAYRFSIDNHRLFLVAMDGYLIEPVGIDYIIIHTGERYDFVIDTSQTQQTNFLMRFETLEVDCETLVRKNSLRNNDGIAVLTYDDSMVDYRRIEQEYANNNPKGCSVSNKCKVINCPFENYREDSNYSCVPLTSLKLSIPTPQDELPDSANVDIESTWFFNFGFDSQEFTSTINGRNFILPSVSLQTEKNKLDMIESQRCKDVEDECTGTQCQCIHIIDIDKNFYGKTVRFVLSSLNTSRNNAFAHPVHLHGHSFHVIKIGYGQYYPNGSLDTPSSDLECEAPCKRAPTWTGGQTPSDLQITDKTLRKDTVIVPAGGYVVIDFIANSPGYWFLHCHIESHQLEGMALVINEVESRHNPPPWNLTTCGNFNWTLEKFEKLKAGSKAGSKAVLVQVEMIALFTAMLFSLLAVVQLFGYIMTHCIGSSGSVGLYMYMRRCVCSEQTYDQYEYENKCILIILRRYCIRICLNEYPKLHATVYPYQSFTWVLSMRRGTTCTSVIVWLCTAFEFGAFLGVDRDLRGRRRSGESGGAEFVEFRKTVFQ